MKALSLDEKKTLVINSYKKALDYELALTTFNVTDEERDLMEADEVFWLQIQQIETSVKEEIIMGLRDIADPNKNPRIATRLEALKELGRILYPEKFVTKKDESKDVAPQVHVYVPDNGRGQDSATKGGQFDLGTIEEDEEDAEGRLY